LVPVARRESEGCRTQSGRTRSQAWSTGVNGTSVNRCRQVLNEDGLSANSTVGNVTMPCLVFKDFQWPSKKADEEMVNIVSNSEILSLSGDAAISYPDNIGISTIYDPTGQTLNRPANNSLLN